MCKRRNRKELDFLSIPVDTAGVAIIVRRRGLMLWCLGAYRVLNENVPVKRPSDGWGFSSYLKPVF